MTLEEIELDQEVICTSIQKDTAFEPNPNRDVGHIGRVRSVEVLKNTALVGHIEMTGAGETGYVEFLTPFLLDELSPYEPLEKPLQLAIQNTLAQITRD